MTGIKSPRHSFKTGAIACLIFFVVSTFAPAFAVTPASAAPASAAQGSLFLGEGSTVLGAPLASSSEPAVPPVGLGSTGVPVAVLGAPTTSPVVFGNWFTDAGGFLIDIAVAGACVYPQTAIFVWVVAASQCVDSLGTVGGAILSPAVKAVINQLNQFWVDSTKEVAAWILTTELGAGNTIQAPKLDTEWFTGQYSLMRAIGLYLVVPMLMLAVITAVVRGSLYFLLRSALVMLPVAILGSVALVNFTSRLLLIADDFSAAIAHRVTDISGFGTGLNTSLDAMGENIGIFAVFFCIMFILAAVVIFIELLLRQTGIYLAAFFMPLAFSALVWPATTKWAKRLVELLIGLIFSKVFIVAALSLGISALGSSGVTAGGATEPALVGLANLAAGAAVLLLAGFAGAKVLAVAPGAAAAAETRVADTRQFWGKGQVLALGVQRRAGGVENKLRTLKPTGSYTNN